MDFKLQKCKIQMNVSRIANIHYFEFTNEYHTEIDSHNFCELIYVDKIIDLIDIKAVIASLDADEIEGIFKEGELEKLRRSMETDDIDTMKKMMRVSTERRGMFDKKLSWKKALQRTFIK